MEAEPMLVEAAAALPARDLRTAIEYWRQVADATGAEERERRQHDGRHLHVSPLLSGMVRVDGDLDPESGQTVITALRCMQDAWAKDGEPDDRTAPQRRADALVALCRSWLDRSDRPEIAGERPHIVVTVDLETLEGRAGKRSELEDAGPITPETARRLACDAGVSRVDHGGPLRAAGRRPQDSPWCPRVSDGRSSSETVGVDSPGAGGPKPGATHITSCTGRKGGETTPGQPGAALPSPPPCDPRTVPSGDERSTGPVFWRADGARLGEDRAPPSLAS